MKILTNGQTLVLSPLTDRTGATVTAYSDRARTVPLTLPLTFSVDQDVFVASEGIGSISRPDGVVLWSGRVTNEGYLSPSASRTQNNSQLSLIPVGVSAPTGVAAIDRAMIQAAIDLLPSTGGSIQLMAGSYDLGSTGLNISKPVRIAGVGASNGPISAAFGNSDAGITILRFNSATADAITVNADACSFENFALLNSATTPTAGAGILVNSGGACTRFDSVVVGGFFRCFNIASGYEWFMTRCVAYDFANTGVRIANPTLPDAGDMGIVNCQIIAGPTRNASYGIEWVSGGGLRMTGNKINKRGAGSFTIGLFLHPADAISTSVFTIVGNSFENATYGIYSDDTGNTGSGSYSKLVISGNEFLTLAGGKQIAITRTNTLKTFDVQISNNVFTSASASSGIQLTKTDQVTIIGNHFASNITSPLTLGASVTSLYIDGIPFTTAGRPAATTMRPGSRYFDTTLNKPVWSTGSAWVDASGAAV